MIFRKLINETGGLTYHAAALRFRKDLWAPFIRGVEEWLAELPPAPELLLFGPSAGWTLSQKTLRRYETVICVEPDPLARWIFRRRFKLPLVQFESSPDLLPWFSHEAYRNFLAAHPQAVVVFANLLGQIPLLVPKSLDVTPARAGFFKSLEGRTWASYHDVLSGALPLNPRAPSELFLENANTEALAAAFFASSPSAGPLIDHETDWLHARRFRIWEIRPGVQHVIGFTISNARGALPLNTENP